MTYTFFWFFRDKQYPFLSNTFSEFVRWTPLNNIFGSKSRTLRQQNSWLIFSWTSLARFVWTFCAMTSYFVFVSTYGFDNKVREWKYFSHIENRIKRNTVTYLFLLFLINNIPFYRTFFSEFVRWTPLNNIFSWKS